MFTGIIKTTATLRDVEARQGDLRMSFRAPGLDLERLRIGDSVAVDGCCLTVVAFTEDGFAADVSNETLTHTSLGALAEGRSRPVNLEPALLAGEPLGGHLVTGHVDGTGEVLERSEDARSTRMRLRAPAALAGFIATKGSICVDGVSLTVNSVADHGDRGTQGTSFEVNLVPHTLEATNLGGLAPGDVVNLEVDLVARYLGRLLDARRNGENGEMDE